MNATGNCEQNETILDEKLLDIAYSFNIFDKKMDFQKMNSNPIIPIVKRIDQNSMDSNKFNLVQIFL